MPSFAYTAINAQGQTVSGSLAVRNKIEAYRKLESQALHPVSVSAVEEKGASSAKAKAKADAEASGLPATLKRTELILFTEEMADLLDAGVQLEQALRVMNERQQNKAIKRISSILRDEIREGARFSTALKKASPSFDPLYRNLVAAGEASGSLGEILRRLATNLKQLHHLQSKVGTAMIYPAVLFAGSIVLMFVFSTILMPMLMELISKTGQKLPFITLILVKFSDFMGAWWWLILLIAFTALLGFRVFIATPQGRAWWDQAKLKIPVFGPVISGRFYAQFCHTMANLVANGVPLLNSLKLMSHAVPNVWLRKILENTVAFVGEGGSLAKGLGQSKAFPLALVDRVAIGEQTGELGFAFEKAAKKYDEELDVRINRLTTFFPQVILIVVAIVIGVIAYAIVTTMFGSVAGISSRK